MPAQSQTQLATISPPPPASSPQLEQVISAFNRVSAELSDTWSDLENRVAHLSTELAAARSARLEELAQKEAIADQLSALMAAMPAGVVVIDADGKVGDANPSALALLGQIEPEQDWDDLLATLQPADGDYETEAGQRLAIAYSDLGAEGARIALLTDITESYELNQLLQREQRLRELGDMAARLAHQLRTPLSSAMLYVSQLAQPEPATAAPTLGAKTMERLHQIETLIESMLRFIRGADEPIESLCLAGLVRDTAAALDPQLDRAGASLLLQIPASGPVIPGRRELLQNALGNLLDNALNSCKDTPHITVSVTTESEWVLLSVEDNGVGIDPELEEQIFEPWFTTRTNGTGLGLAVVASAAEAHGGRVEVAAAAGGGSRFTLVLPSQMQKENP